MNAIGIALLASLALVAPPTLAALIGSAHKGRTITLGALTGVVLTVINSLVFYFGTPVVGFSMDSFYSSFWMWFLELAVVVIVLAADSAFGHDGSSSMWKTSSSDSLPSTGSWVSIIPTVLLLVFGLVVGVGGVFNQGRADTLKQALDVQVHENVNDLPNTDTAHILTVPPEVVNLKVKSALKGDATTRFAVHDNDYPVMVDGHVYWITGIYPDDWSDYNKVGGNARGYIITDAEDYNANSQYIWDAALGIDTNPHLMQVHENGWFQHDVERLLWNEYRDQIVANLHLEIDDNRKPWFVATLNERPLGFSMGNTFPRKVITVDPATRAIKEYSFNKADKLDAPPAWIDQIWDAGAVSAALGYWGQWDQANYGFFYEGPANRYKVSGDPQIIATKDGLAWQVLMTSQKKDTVASYYVLVNARTGQTDAYKVPELQLEEGVAKTIEESGANRNRLKPTHLALYKISGTLTWIAPLLRKDSDTGTGAESNFNGLAAIPAQQVNGTSVTLKETGDIRGDLYRDYERFLAQGQTTGSPQNEAKEVDFTGTVGFVSPVVPEGNVSAVYFTLAEKPGVEFRVEFNMTKFPEVKYLKEGHKVSITYRDTAKSPLNVINFDDVDVQLTTK